MKEYGIDVYTIMMEYTLCAEGSIIHSQDFHTIQGALRFYNEQEEDLKPFTFITHKREMRRGDRYDIGVHMSKVENEILNLV